MGASHRISFNFDSGKSFSKAFVVSICFVLTLFMFQTKFAYKNANEIYKKTDVEKNYSPKYCMRVSV